MENFNSYIRRWWALLTLLLLAAVPASAQERAVDGVVCDAAGVPLTGVTVIVKENSAVGTITSSEGRFRLNVADNATLVFSYVGYATVERKVLAGESFMRITLQDDSKLVDEIVVVGYGTKRKGGVSAAVSSINSDDIVRSTSSTTAGAIVGKIAGITARQKSGEPGASANLQIRNMGAPLYVIDGIMTDAGSFNNLDINDIENISVLKEKWPKNKKH